MGGFNGKKWTFYHEYITVLDNFIFKNIQEKNIGIVQKFTFSIKWNHKAHKHVLDNAIKCV